MKYDSKKEGTCTDLTSNCHHTTELTLDYSGEANKILTAKSNLLIQPAQSNGRRNNPQRITADAELSHPATGLYSKIFFRSPNEQSWRGGVEFKNAQRVIKSYSTSVEYTRELSTVTVNVSVPLNLY